jgi:hypothetical protein
VARVDKWKVYDFCRDSGGRARADEIAEHFRIGRQRASAVAREAAAAGLVTLRVETKKTPVKSRRAIPGASRRVTRVVIYCKR